MASTNILSTLVHGFTLILLLFLPQTANAQDGTFSMELLVPENSLTRAWDIHYAPDDQLWITERSIGRLLRLDPETGAEDELLVIPGAFSASGQDGLLGFALHKDFDDGSPFVYLSYTYLEFLERRQAILRYTFTEVDGDGSLVDAVLLMDGLPASNDHNSGRLVFGPDQKLYYTIGDQGNNQNRNYCSEVVSQFLPTQEQIDQSNWINYPGKTLRLNLDGSIPEDNPVLGGVRSHIFTLGHRNAQGLAFSASGLLYSSEHGPNTDDEVNLLTAGSNYGWPRVVGMLDDQAYDYCNWSSLDNCSDLTFSKTECPPGAEFFEESSFTDPTYRDPLMALFAVTDDYDFENPICEDSYTCRPNIAPSSLAIYESDAIPGWKNSLLIPSLKRGRLYRLKLDDSGQAIVGDTTHHFYSGNRYRDIALAPDGKTFYLLTDQAGPVTDESGLNRLTDVRNPGTIMKVTYEASVSVPSVLDAREVSIYPNPATDLIRLNPQRPDITIASVTLLDARGAVVKQVDQLGGGPVTLAVDEVAAGVYFVKVVTDRGSLTRRVVVR
ncbi:glucose/sorbosone family PQQ-dependent dehydrogenase [Lewinella sp. 4G2]|uniref:glucose/sorbosone family PQQ-dependent dehydrogenase n=1 Tax=Lewinella sp. 4G2 TaxID=1803372 RepID=UPI0007B4AE8D|nr:glucose/sorbosone family PQQ-dependent dehydrogenase [Lewinella sp. 4G2]OAV42832.1 hypothetical protein A3850_016510 [Lewinella sp. 4G2]